LALFATKGQSVGTSGIIIGFLIFALCRYWGDKIEEDGSGGSTWNAYGCIRSIHGVRWGNPRLKVKSVGFHDNRFS
jgi:hypothetical protein